MLSICTGHKYSCVSCDSDIDKMSVAVHVNEFLIVFEKRILVPDMTPEPIFALQKFSKSFMAGLTNQPHMANSTHDTPLQCSDLEYANQ